MSDGCEHCGEEHKTLEQMREWEKECVEKYGFYVHGVDDHEVPHNYNFHTHGIEEKFGHSDFQVVLPMNPNQTMGIFHTLVERIKAGEKFESGKRYSDVITNFDMTFVDAQEGGRFILRCVFPPPSGELAREKMDNKKYEVQYDQTGLQVH